MANFKSDESVFNIAFAYLQRIDRILTMCWVNSNRMDLVGWHKNLKALYRELSIKLGPEEEVLIMGSPDDKMDLVHLSSKDATMYNINYIFNQPGGMNVYSKQLSFLLEQVEVKMRRQLQKKGMLLPSKNDPRYAVLEM